MNNTLTVFTSLRGLIATAICAALASSCSTVPAAKEREPANLIVKFADLNLATSPGALALYIRIRDAAQRVCAFYVSPSNRCVDDAIANAVIKVNQPTLFAVYNAKNKPSLPNTLVSQSR